MTEARYRYTALDVSGRRIQDVITSPSVSQAAAALAALQLRPLSLTPIASSSDKVKNRGLRLPERVLILRQLSLMLEAGVGLLEAMQTVTDGVEAKIGAEQLQAVISALRRGSGFAVALETHAPGFPFYVYAMSRVGEATGRLSSVLSDAGEQVAYEEKLRREFLNAMTYPAFLATAGFGAVIFIFTQVVPRFSVMLGERRTGMPLISRLVLDIGTFANTHVALVLGGLGALAGLVAYAIVNEGVRNRIVHLGRYVPVVRSILAAREIAAWARLLAFSIGNGVLLLDAAMLARQATRDGPFRRGLTQFERDLRAGVAVDDSLARHTPLTRMDLSLLKAGQKSGTLGRMFGFIADGYDAQLRDAMKRLTSLVEPVAIGLVSILVGIVALSLVLALSSVYDNIL